MYLFTLMCKKLFFVDLLVPAVVFSANMIQQTFESRPNLHVSFKINRGQLK